MEIYKFEHFHDCWVHPTTQEENRSNSGSSDNVLMCPVNIVINQTVMFRYTKMEKETQEIVSGYVHWNLTR